MESIDILALLPLIVLSASVVIIMMVIAFYRNHRLTLWLSLIGLAATFVTLPVVSSYAPRQVTDLMILDGYAVFYIGLLLVTSFAVLILSYGYLEGYSGEREEFYLLVLLATLGSAVLVVSDHFFTFFLGLEILSVALYAMVSYTKFDRHRIEAAIKYLILAGVAAAFLLFGMALIYLQVGSMAFEQIAASNALSGALTPVVLAGLGLIIVGVGFKLALVPFHMWTPDVYQGAPAPVTAFIATVSKGGMFALMLRYFTEISFYEQRVVWLVFAAIAVASMLLGNLLALMQDNVKRILAYSSIAHLGYLMVAFLAGGTLGQNAVAFYLASYFVTSLSAFGVVTVLSHSDDESEALERYRALFWRKPWIALIFIAALLSLAGIPPTAGLVGKIFIAAAGVDSSLWFLLIVLVLGSVIGVFYYLRVVITMFRRDPELESEPVSLPSLSVAGGALLTVLTVLLIGLGLYPVPLLSIIERMLGGLV